MPVKREAHPFHMDHWMHHVYLPPPKKKKKKIGSNHCFQFLLGITVISGEIEDNGYAQGALWSIWKWWIYSFMVENFGFFCLSTVT